MSEPKLERQIGTPQKSEADKQFEVWWEKVEGKPLTEAQRKFLKEEEEYQGQLSNQQKHLAISQAESLGMI